VHRPPVFLAFLLLAATPLFAADTPLDWLNAMRAAASPVSAAPVVEDGQLAAVAGRWAAVLAKAGVLTHRGADGSGVLDRYRAMGGTDARVGEIIGAGPGLDAVEKAWARSAEHSGLVRTAAWTHAGWGMARAGTQQVWVVLFCEKLVTGLRLDGTGGGLTVSGSFSPAGAEEPVLFTGLDLVPPASWDAATRAFSYTLPASALPSYIRLGWGTASGGFRLTNAFTWPPGTGSPAGQDHFAAPAGSP
jgi:hypothetical protein